MKTARPSKPNTMEGTCRKIVDVDLDDVGPAVLGRELLQIDGGRDAHGKRDQEADQQCVEGADDGAREAGQFRGSGCPR